MATTIASLLTQVRAQLVEATARFWTDAELRSIMRLGALDLWGAILDLHQDHYFRVTTDPVLRANASEISGVPPDCFRILLIEPADTSSSAAGHQCIFTPAKYKDTAFAVARSLTAQDPTSLPSREIYYDIVGEGSPVAPPQILTAPLISSDLRVRLVYCPTIWPDGAASVPENNPIPGESDNALKAWTIAFARAKETETRQPDSGWLGVYATEKQTILTRLTPREEQEPDVVEDLFQGFGGYW